jgi:ppGpp synthetase/RelA/SpoT-type nucleotidyltranferase
LNFKNILNEFTKNVENIKKREEPKLQSSRLLGRSSNKMKRVETRIKNLETIKNKLEGLKLVI